MTLSDSSILYRNNSIFSAAWKILLSLVKPSPPPQQTWASSKPNRFAIQSLRLCAVKEILQMVLQALPYFLTASLLKAKVSASFILLLQAVLGRKYIELWQKLQVIPKLWLHRKVLERGHHAIFWGFILQLDEVHCCWTNIVSCTRLSRSEADVSRMTGCKSKTTLEHKLGSILHALKITRKGHGELVLWAKHVKHGIEKFTAFVLDLLDCVEIYFYDEKGQNNFPEFFSTAFVYSLRLFYTKLLSYSFPLSEDSSYIFESHFTKLAPSAIFYGLHDHLKKKLKPLFKPFSANPQSKTAENFESKIYCGTIHLKNLSLLLLIGF